MLSHSERETISQLIKREVVPAMGCTEPVAVSLAVAKATELLGRRPSHIEACLSGNIIKNAMGVGIPGTGMIGLPIAIALGALIGKSAYGLEVMKDVCPEAVESGRQYINEGRINISHMPDAPSILHIDITVSDGDDSARAVISCEHTRFIRLERNGEIMLDEQVSGGNDSSHDDKELNLATVYEYAIESPIEELEFILEARRLNMHAAQTALAGEYGHSLGATLRKYGLK